jgi:hypothetical protein
MDVATVDLKPAPSITAFLGRRGAARLMSSAPGGEPGPWT